MFELYFGALPVILGIVIAFFMLRRIHWRYLFSKTRKDLQEHKPLLDGTKVCEMCDLVTIPKTKRFCAGCEKDYQIIAKTWFPDFVDGDKSRNQD